MSEPVTVPATSPVPQGVADELRRVVQRWQQLPLDHALRCLPVVREVLAGLTGPGQPDVPDLGPAVVMDQLTVLVHDACVADATPRRAAELEAALTGLRRALS